MTDEVMLLFPIQKEDLMDERLSDQEMVYQLKLKAAALLNSVAMGDYRLDMENIRALLQMNELCEEVGIEPLDFDLDALTNG